MQFINIAFVVLIINFNFSDGPFLGFLPIFNGDYPDFTAFWYTQVGKQICFTLALNIVTPHVGKLARYYLKLCRRCFDRRCRCSIQKFEDNDTELNTMKMLQSELNDLYTGD